MEQIFKFRKWFDMPIIPFLLSILVACICAVVALYGLSSMLQSEPQFTLATAELAMFNDSGFLQGLASLSASIIAYVLWLEIGNDYILKKLR